MDPRTHTRSIALATGAALALASSAVAQSGGSSHQGQQGDQGWYQQDQGSWQQQGDTWGNQGQSGNQGWNQGMGNQGQSGQGWNQGMGNQGQSGQGWNQGMGNQGQSGQGWNQGRSGNQGWNQGMGNQRQSGQGWNQSGSQGQMGGQGQQQEPQWELSPDGYVYVAYDVDQDGTYDYYEAIWYLDLERARRGSQGRQGMQQQGQAWQQQGRQQQGQQGWQQQDRQQQGQQGRFAQSGQRSMWDRWNQQGQDPRMGRAREASARMGARQPARYDVQGQIQDIRKVELIGQDQPHLMARIQTQQGNTALVNLGPADRVGDLARNEDVSVTGTLGKVNGKAVLMADRIEYQGQTMNVQRPDDRDLKRFSGRVQSTREASFQNADQQHLIAKVRLDSGQTVDVSFGPAEKLEGKDLEGKQIRFLADGIKINGQKALRAEQVRFDGQKIELRRSMERDRFRSSGSGGQRQMQGGSGSSSGGGNQGY